MNLKQTKLLKDFFVALMCVSAMTVNAQSVTKNFRNVPLKSVLKEVERQTKMSVIYKVDEVDANRKITANFKSTPVKEVLRQVLGDELDYQVDNRMITIRRRQVAKPKTTVNQQSKSSRKVSGTILDEKGDPVIGATIKEKGTKNATVSDLDGNFTFTVSEGSTLLISYL